MNIEPNTRNITLERGLHRTQEAGMCAMEAVAWLAGEPHTDHPACVCPVIAAAMRMINDCLSDVERQRLVPYLARLIGTRGDTGLERRRGFAAADWACRVAVPRTLRALGLVEPAQALESLAPVVDTDTARAAERAALYARHDDAAANYAANAAAAAANYAAYPAAAADAAAAAAGNYAANAGNYAANAAWPELIDRLLEVA